MSDLNWYPIAEPPIRHCGWFAGAMNPANHAELTPEQINEWRKEYGFTKVWYNRDAHRKWWEPDFHGDGSKPVDDRLTHWAELPSVPYT